MKYILILAFLLSTNLKTSAQDYSKFETQIDSLINFNLDKNKVIASPELLIGDYYMGDGYSSQTIRLLSNRKSIIKATNCMGANNSRGRWTLNNDELIIKNNSETLIFKVVRNDRSEITLINPLLIEELRIMIKDLYKGGKKQEALSMLNSLEYKIQNNMYKKEK